jgi:outer membrane receptor protein involved in Fe transport
MVRRVGSFTAYLAAFISTFLAAGVAWAGNTGKISGRVVDAQSTDPIMSATVIVEGTTLGAQTDLDGYYTILNVNPGTYSVQVRYVGYSTIVQQGVEVRADQTSTVEFLLKVSAVEGDTIEVIGNTSQVINFNTAGTQRSVSADRIATLPVTTVDEVLNLQVGFVKQGDQLHVRGGRSGEVLTIVDGVQVRDPLGGRGGFDGEGGSDAALNVATQSIQEVNIIKGGFDAEYGNAQSAIVNITTREGSLSGTDGEIRYITDNFRVSSLNEYSFNYDRLQIALGGPDPITNQVLPSLGVGDLRGKMSYYLSFTGTKQDAYRNYNAYIDPGVQQEEFRSRDILGFNVSDRFVNGYNLEAKLTYKATPTIRVNFNYQGAWDDFTGWDWDYLYTPNTAPDVHEDSRLLSLKWSQNLSKSTFYQLQVSQFYKDYLERPGDPNQPGSGLNPDQFLLNYEVDKFSRTNDVNKNGKWDSAEEFENQFEDYNVDGTPKYTFGDQYLDKNGDGRFTSGVDSLTWDWNNNGSLEFDQGEPFTDRDNDGSWDTKEAFIDGNANGVYDEDRRDVFEEDLPEPFTDGDINVGEPFVDVNQNGVYDSGIDRFIISTDPTVNQDLNFNSVYDGPGDVPTFIPGTYVDLNRNGRYDFPNGIYDQGEPYVDLDNNGDFTPSDNFFDLDTHQDEGWYEERSIKLTTIQGDFTWQARREHQLKTGVLLEWNYLEKALLESPWAPYDGVPDGGPYPDRGLRRDFYQQEPLRGALYLQDLMEYGQMIARLGIRWDFFLQSDQVTEDPLRTFGEVAVEDAQHRVSPRVGFSYPITDKAKIYFNYGHFYQLPTFQYMYRQATQATSAGGPVGNANLSYEKTIQYEFGVQYALSDQYSLTVAGFYKDYFDLVSTTIGETGPLARVQYVNSDYARSRGFELTLDKVYGNYVSGFFNYQYAFAYGKASSANENYELLFASRFIPIDEFPLEWDVRHQFTLNIDLRIGHGQHPRLFGLKLWDNWGANVTWQYNSGFPYTPTRDNPNAEILPGQVIETNSLRKPAASTVDLRFYQNFSVYGSRWSLELWVQNLFNTDNVNEVYAATGRANTSQNTGGVISDGVRHDQDPNYYLPTRNIRLGLSLRF